MTPTARLKVALRAMPPAQRQALIAAGHAERLIRRAALGEAVNASTHVQLAAALGFDPASGSPIAPRSIGPLHYASLSAALRMKRIAGKLTLRAAARHAGMSYSALGRIERGEAVSIEAILAACAWLARHPFDFVSPAVARETSGETQAA
jgi:hypothetical protein